MRNKDEALGFKDSAEACMRKNEFTTACGFAIKAKEIDASLTNVVSRMIAVCDVHCAKLEKSGDEVDMYKILQVEEDADADTIKKQYKNLALLLHPDKNSFHGAESAFKIIGEANKVLLDEVQKRRHDCRRKPVEKAAPTASSSYQPPKAPTTGVSVENNNGKKKRKNMDSSNGKKMRKNNDSSNGKKKRKNRDSSCSKSSVEGEEVPAGQPSFNVEVKLTHSLYCCPVKHDFARTQMPQVSTEFTISHRHGTNDVAYRPGNNPGSSVNSPKFSVGWSNLVKKCKFVIGDTLKFTLINRDRNQMGLEVILKP